MQTVTGHGAWTQASVTQMKRAMRFSLGVGLAVLALKAYAFVITDSTAMLGDALESSVHLIAIGFAFFSLRVSLTPADSRHRYGHGKISFFSAGVEGGVVLVAGLAIVAVAAADFLRGPQLSTLGWGMLLALVIAGVNLWLGLYLMRTGRRENSLILSANGRHILVDSITTGGVVLAFGLVYLTGWAYWDPILALCIGAHVLLTGSSLLRQSIGGLMDEADPVLTNQLDEILEAASADHGGSHHELRHRSLGDSVSVEYHLLLPGATSLEEAHRIATEIEILIENRLPPGALITTHLEPVETHHEIHGEISGTVEGRR